MRKLLFALSFLAIVSCKETSKTEVSESQTSLATDTPSNITLNETKPSESSTAVETTAIQKKTFNDKEMLLTKAQVVGSILSVEFQVNTPEGKLVDFKFPLDEVNYIDDALSKKVGLLKDDAGVYMANPLSSNNKFILLRGKANNYLVSMKFPAPPAESRTVSFNIPNFGSFDQVQITR